MRVMLKYPDEGAQDITSQEIGIPILKMYSRLRECGDDKQEISLAIEMLCDEVDHPILLDHVEITDEEIILHHDASPPERELNEAGWHRTYVPQHQGGGFFFPSPHHPASVKRVAELCAMAAADDIAAWAALKEAGHIMHLIGGFGLMYEFCMAASVEYPLAAGVLNGAWHGIGDWQQ